MAECGTKSPLPAAMAESLKLYEAQFFGFTPQTCMLRVYSSFQDCLYEILLAVETVIIKKMGGATAGRSSDGSAVAERVRECTQEFLSFLQGRVSLISSRMEILLQSSVLTVPQNVVLPEDAPHHKYPHSSQQLAKLEAEMSRLQRRYQAQVFAKQALLAELEEQREAQAELDRVLQWIGELKAAWRESGMGNVHESLDFMIQTARCLQETLKEISLTGSGKD
ncbi:UNVERIFIED_CONTAM: hypothetical protein FKN15_072444 [Acipenser sinensis]